MKVVVRQKGLSCTNEEIKKHYLMRDTFSVSIFVSTSRRFCVSNKVNTACERLEVAFMFVAATVLALIITKK